VFLNLISENKLSNNNSKSQTLVMENFDSGVMRLMMKTQPHVKDLAVRIVRYLLATGLFHLFIVVS